MIINPWIEIANKLGKAERNCFYLEDDDYVCIEDKARIDGFNKKLDKDDSDKIILNTPPEPWRGNPNKANLIILSLNPGYDPNINKSLAKLIQSNESIRKRLAKFRKETMLLEEDSFMPLDDKDDTDGISCKEAEDMLSGWYWTKKLKTLRDECKASGIGELEFYKRVTVIEFFGYSSTTCKKGFPLYGDLSGYLKSQDYTKQLIQQIVETRKNEVRFLILRAKDKWEKFLGEVYDNETFLCKGNKGRCQSLSRENLSEDVYNKILIAIKREF